MKTAPAILLILSLPLWPLAAQTASTTPTAASTTPTTPAASGPANPAKPDLSIPADKAQKWVVGFCVFSGEGLPPEDQYLTYSIPLMLKNQLAGLTTHVITPAERDAIRKELVDKALAEVDKNITGLMKERDALFLDSGNPSPAATQAVEAKIAAAMARRAFLRTLDLSKITVADQKPLEVQAGKGAGNLFDAPTIPASIFCDRQGIDLLVYGMVREVEGYVLVDVSAWDAASNSPAVSYRDAEPREQAYQALSGVGAQLTTLFLGKPWASLSFTPDPPESSLYVDGKLVATGRTPVLYLNPGDHELKVTAPGYRDLTRPLTLTPDQEASLTVTLEKKETGTVVISSTPPGADVYVESVWKGRTPLTLERPFERTWVDITASGFYDKPFSISEFSPTELSFVLQPDTISRDAIQRKAREDFYNSFAWFALSLPIPLFCYAFALDSAVEYNQLVGQGDLSKAASVQMKANILYGGYIAGTVVSAGLFTWMLFRIIHYVTVSTRTAG